MDTAVSVVQAQKVEQVDSEGWLEVRDGHGRLLFKVEPQERQMIHIRRSGKDYVVALKKLDSQLQSFVML